jgi:protein O-GlcNAc transferase
MKAMDAVIDPMHFSMGTTLCSLFAAGIPVATCPGRFMRGGFTKMLYALMRIENAPIAKDASSLAELSIKLAHAPKWRQALEQEILKHEKLLYGNRQILDEWKSFFETAWKKASS